MFIAGAVKAAVLAPQEMAGLAQSGEVRPPGVASAGRLAASPEVPTLREFGRDVVVVDMEGLCAPPGLPDEIHAPPRDRLRRGTRVPARRTFLERTGAMDGHLDRPGFQAAPSGLANAARARGRLAPPGGGPTVLPPRTEEHPP